MRCPLKHKPTGAAGNNGVGLLVFAAKIPKHGQAGLGQGGQPSSDVDLPLRTAWQLGVRLD
jgi:hypothetical protein